MAVLGTVFGLSCCGADQSSQCNTAGTRPRPKSRAAGLAEQVGDIVITLLGRRLRASLRDRRHLYVTLNTNITNSLDANGNPQFITVTNSGAAAFTANPATLTSATTLALTNINYTVPANNAIPVIITISGIRAAVASINNGSVSDAGQCHIFRHRLQPDRRSGERGIWHGKSTFVRRQQWHSV
jgi:hypothetical protein